MVKHAGTIGLSHAILTASLIGSTLTSMDMDDFTPNRGRNPLGPLQAQDLGPLSVTDLEERIAALQAEIERTRTHMEQTARHRAGAEALFKK